MVVVEEEDTTRELRRLESTLSMAVKQIYNQYRIGDGCLCCRRMEFFIVLFLQGIAQTAEEWRQLIKRMEPLAEENEKLKEALNLMERNI